MFNPLAIPQRDILTTPLEIYHAASRFFPNTVVKVLALRPELRITLQLNAASEPLTITKGIDRGHCELKLALTALHSTEISEAIIMPALTQTAVPLEQGVEFERQMCASCVSGKRSPYLI